MSALDEAMAAYGAQAQPDALDTAMAAYASRPQLTPKVPSVTAKADPGMLAVIKNGFVKGAAGFGDMLGNAAVNTANLGIAGYGMAAHAVTGRADSMPDLIPSDALSGYRKIADATGLTQDANEPTTGAQRVADFTAQVLGGGGVNPRTLAKSAMALKALPFARDLVTPTVGGLAGGATQEALRDNIDPDTTLGRIANATLPALAQFGASMPTAGASTAAERAGQTTRNVMPQQWAAADQLAKKAAQLGAPITAPEALQAITGANPGLTTLQRVTEQSTPGVNRLAPAMAQRPAQNAALFGRVADGIYANEIDPGAIGGTLKNAADAAIGNARNQGLTAAAPFYAKSSNDPSVKIPSNVWNSLVSDPAIASALQKTKADPLSGVTDAQAGSLQWLDAAKKRLDAQGSKAGQSGDFNTPRLTGIATNSITSAVDPLVPDYAKARGIIAQNMRDNVEPMQAGQVGKLASTSDFVNQAGSLLPEKPMDITPSVVQQTAKTVGAQDPTILNRFVAQHLRGTFNEANQDLQNGANQYGGAKFAAKVAGNDMQSQNLTSLLSSSGKNPQGLLDALDVWKAQGTRPQVGSATTFNNGESGLLSGAGSYLSAIGKPLSLPGLLMDKAKFGMSTKALSEAMMPDGMTVERFQALARANGAHSPTEQAQFAALLRAGSAPQQAQQVEH